ncbi:hypothetical protein IFM89_036805 [Coptis chinensis]|uniref:Regulator of MON1-CCZ1 complex N-terminal domain-containing protein n=1 Tax=Coptis chinensis TaxID=261450 RepID=A0A835LKV9_9MAGN|nr:hypothetical protein IFM89_036805 [Coptis chinensis]
MRASYISIINGYVKRLKLVLQNSATLQHLSCRNFVLPCYSYSDNDLFIIPNESETFFPEKHDFVLTTKSVECDVSGNKERGFFEQKRFVNSRIQKQSLKRVKSILVKRGWNLDLPKGQMIELEDMNVNQILNDIFYETSNAALAFRFFTWCEQCNGSKNGIRSVCTMIHIFLVSGNMNHKVMRLVNDLVAKKDGTEEFDHLIFNVLEETHKDIRGLETVYSMLVSKYVGQNLLSMALDLVCRMMMLNIFPASGVCNSLIRKLLESKEMEVAWGILDEMHIRGMVNTSIISLFIHELCAEGRLASACKLLVEMQNYGIKPDVVAYTIVIHAICKMGLLKEATSMLFKMTRTGFLPDSVTVASVVNGYCVRRRLNEAVTVLKVFGFAANVFVYNSFISKLCWDGDMVQAHELFHEMSELGIHPDSCSYTTIIKGYCGVGNLNKALMLVGQMLKNGFKLAVVTYTVLIDSYCKTGDLKSADYLFRMIEREGLRPDVVTYNSLMDGYSKKGYLHKAFELVDTMRLADVSPNVASYNIIVHGLVKRGFEMEARAILDELVRRGFSPDVLTFTSIIDGLSKARRFEEAFLVWSHMSEHGMRPDVVTCSALLHGYCLSHRMDEANALFCKMLDAGLEPDLVLYNTLVNGFCNQGNLQCACHLVNMMAERGIIPNNVTYKALVRGFEKKCLEARLRVIFFNLLGITILWNKVFVWKTAPISLQDAPNVDLIDEGTVLSIRYSLDGKVIGIQRSNQEIQFWNRETGQDFTQRCRSDSESILGFFWTDCATCDVIFVKTSGLDLFTYESELKALRFVETKKLNVSWYVYTHESRMALLASGMQCKTLSGFQCQWLAKFPAAVFFLFPKISGRQFPGYSK